jgi:N-acetylglucosaminyl-diphospho-decaprenol L-rhamnosyltransferase
MSSGVAGASAVVVAFHRPHLVRQLIAGLEVDAKLEVIVVNVDDDPDVREVAHQTGVRVVALRGNPGYAAGVNAGAAIATGEIVVFMNDDVLVDRASFDALVAAVNRGDYSVAVPEIRDSAGTREPSILPLASVRSLIMEWLLLPDTPIAWLQSRVSVQKWRQPTCDEPIDAAQAAVVAVRRPLLTAIPLPEDFRMYWEEVAWFGELNKRGYKVLYEPAAVVTHFGGRDDVRADKSRYLARNAVRCVRRSKGRWSAMIAWPVVLLWQLRLLVTAYCRASTKPEVRDARWAGVRAAISGWREVS